MESNKGFFRGSGGNGWMSKKPKAYGVIFHIKTDCPLL